MHDYFVYIVEYFDKSYYVGVTNDTERRLSEHNQGLNENTYTYSRRPVVLKYCAHFRYIKDAILWEKLLKGWGRKKKEALFDSDWATVKELAACKNKTSYTLRSTND